ncbi:hypothetical protein LOK74_09250 [Brevibacillus humidisoli]|uniref:hypothetical protein n=1 Tax=Brevibacillus humidisoli TaxID=2895522 RepID=UPI001E53ED6E|nr:hypothetical protein [Brevibacillus humidisoli]UFJ42655.1 hypothetical protein LOK74_09250 [Brevibacillus humidisoli]
MKEVRTKPEEITNMINKWKQSTSGRRSSALDFEEISRKTKRASDVLGKVQNFMNSIADYAKEQDSNK